MQTSSMISANNRLLTKKLLAFLCIVGVLGAIFYRILNHTSVIIPVTFMPSYRRLLPCSSSNSYPLISSEVLCSQCCLSLKESDGWFCEFDQEWQRRKSLHRVQEQRNHVSDERRYFFLNNWDPTIHCEFEQKIGVGDGGKWVCDIHKLKHINSTPPLVYSLGSNGDFTFEKAIKQELPESEIHTFDQNIYMCPANVCIFHQVYLGDGLHDGSKSLHKILDDLNHRERDIDILKVDIEGSEFQLFGELFKLTNISNNVPQSLTSKVLPYIRQILVEIHLKSNTGEDESRRAHTFFENFRRNNYAIFHKEPNLAGCQNIFEYAFIRLNPTFFITPNPPSLQ